MHVHGLKRKHCLSVVSLDIDCSYCLLVPLVLFLFCLSSSSASGAGASSGAQDRNVGLITIYANGFIIGQGEFRDVKEAKNKQFLEDLKRGEVPDELNALCMKEWPGAGDVAVSLIDKSAETFVPPKPKFSFASSQGQSLGAGAAAAAGASAAASAQAFAGATPQRLQVDPSQPTTTLQLVLGGRKVKETANQSATVLQLYQHFMRYELSLASADDNVLLSSPDKRAQSLLAHCSMELRAGCVGWAT